MAPHILPRLVLRVVPAAIIVFATASLIGQLWRLSGHTSGAWVIRQLSLDDELNLPTAYQAITIGLCAICLALIAKRIRELQRPGAIQWLGLSAIFLLLACDEAFRIHERMGQFRHNLPFGLGQTFRTGWIIFGVAFVGIIGLSYLRFMLRLPMRSRVLFILAGTLYIGGAVGMEIIVGPWVEAHGRDNLTYQLLANLEEVLEMSGIGVFLYALTSYLASLAPTGPDIRSGSYRSREPQPPPAPAARA